jgi:hypothetical protein
MAKSSLGRAALGFSTHTGWAAMVAAAGTPSSPEILVRSRIEMMGNDRDRPRFVYHVARELTLQTAERIVREAAELSRSRALAALETAVADLGKRDYEVVASGIIVGNRPFEASLETIVKSHALVHAAEAELFRSAIKNASEALKIHVVEIRVKDLEPRATKLFGVTAGPLAKRLAALGRAAGRPWARDQRDSLLAALLASSMSNVSRAQSGR